MPGELPNMLEWAPVPAVASQSRPAQIAGEPEPAQSSTRKVGIAVAMVASSWMPECRVASHTSQGSARACVDGVGGASAPGATRPAARTLPVGLGQQESVYALASRCAGIE